MKPTPFLRPDAFLWGQAFVLFLAGAWLLALPERTIYLAALTVFAAFGGLGLLRCLMQPTRITIWDLLLASLCLGYGLGTLNTELTWIDRSAAYLTVTTASPLFIMQATGWLMLLASALSTLSAMDHARPFEGLAIPPPQHKVVLWGLFGVIAAALTQIATGRIGFHQDMTDGGVQVSALATLTVSAICPSVALASFVWPQSSGWTRRLMATGVGVLLMVQFYQGRRVFIYSLVIAMLCQFAARPTRRLLVPSRLLGLAVAALMVLGASKAFFALRMAMWELGSARDTVALLSRGSEILVSGERSSLGEELAQNQQSRTFIVGYLAELMQALETYPPLYGDVLGFDLAISVPSILWPGKYRVLAYGAEEGVANPHFGMRIDDQANSLETTGVSDLGLPGLFIYPIALCLIYRFVLQRARALGSAVYLLIAAALINNLLNVEIGTAEFVGTLRSMAILLITAWAARFVWRSLTSTEPVIAWLPLARWRARQGAKLQRWAPQVKAWYAYRRNARSTDAPQV